VTAWRVIRSSVNEVPAAAAAVVLRRLRVVVVTVVHPVVVAAAAARSVQRAERPVAAAMVPSAPSS